VPRTISYPESVGGFLRVLVKFLFTQRYGGRSSRKWVCRRCSDHPAVAGGPHLLLTAPGKIHAEQDHGAAHGTGLYTPASVVAWYEMCYDFSCYFGNI
jgi:hypothetical protein